MKSISITSLQNLINTQRQISLQQSLTDKEFIADYKSTTAYARIVENNVLMLKHKTMPDAIKAGKVEIDFFPMTHSFVAPWVLNDPHFKSITLDVLFEAFTKIFIGYKVSRVSNSECFKINWETKV